MSSTKVPLISPHVWAWVQAGGWHHGWGWGGVLRCRLFPSRGVVHSQPVLMTGIPGDRCWHDLSADLLLERYHRACKQAHPVVWPGGASQGQWYLKDLTRQGEMIYSVYTALNVRLSASQCCLRLLWWTFLPNRANQYDLSAVWLEKWLQCGETGHYTAVLLCHKEDFH